VGARPVLAEEKFSIGKLSVMLAAFENIGVANALDSAKLSSLSFPLENEEVSAVESIEAIQNG
jgi:hypothetical protein